MEIDDLTIGDAKKLACMFGKKEESLLVVIHLSARNVFSAAMLRVCIMVNLSKKMVRKLSLKMLVACGIGKLQTKAFLLARLRLAFG